MKLLKDMHIQMTSDLENTIPTYERQSQKNNEWASEEMSIYI